MKNFNSLVLSALLVLGSLAIPAKAFDPNGTSDYNYYSDEPGYTTDDFYEGDNPANEDFADCRAEAQHIEDCEQKVKDYTYIVEKIRQLNEQLRILNRKIIDRRSQLRVCSWLDSDFFACTAHNRIINQEIRALEAERDRLEAIRDQLLSDWIELIKEMSDMGCKIPKIL